MGNYDMSVGFGNLGGFDSTADAVMFFQMLDAAKKEEEARTRHSAQISQELQETLSGVSSSKTMKSELDSILNETDNISPPRQQDLEDLLASLEEQDADDKDTYIQQDLEDLLAGLEEQDVADTQYAEPTEYEKLLADVAVFTAKKENGEDDIDAVADLTKEELAELINIEDDNMVDAETLEDYNAAKSRLEAYSALYDFYNREPNMAPQIIKETVVDEESIDLEPEAEVVLEKQAEDISEKPFNGLAALEQKSDKSEIVNAVEEPVETLEEQGEVADTPVASETETEDEIAQVIASYYDNDAQAIKKLSTQQLYNIYDHAVNKYNVAVSEGEDNIAEFYQGLAHAVDAMTELRASVPAMDVTVTEKTGVVEEYDKVEEKPFNGLAALAQKADISGETTVNIVVSKSENKNKSESSEDMLELLIRANMNANKNKELAPIKIVPPGYINQRAKDIEDRTEQDLLSVGKAIISPITATNGLVDMVKCDFDNGQKQIRGAASDFLSVPAGVVAVANDAVEAIVNEFAGETAGKVAAAPGNFVSGAWQTVSTSFDGKEGTTKKSFLKMITFGFCN